MTKFRLAKPCQNKKSTEAEETKRRSKRNANECLFNTSLCYETWQTPLSPGIPILRKSILTSPFEMAMHGQYIL